MSVIKDTLDKDFVALTNTWNKLVAETVIKRIDEKKKEIISKINGQES